MKKQDLNSKFSSTYNHAQQELLNKLDREKKKLINGEIFNSVNHARISLEKLLENLSEEDLAKNKQHIDNIYYHLGALRGCCE